MKKQAFNFFKNENPPAPPKDAPIELKTISQKITDLNPEGLSQEMVNLVNWFKQLVPMINSPYIYTLGQREKVVGYLYSILPHLEKMYYYRNKNDFYSEGFTALLIDITNRIIKYFKNINHENTYNLIDMEKLNTLYRCAVDCPYLKQPYLSIYNEFLKIRQSPWETTDNSERRQMIYNILLDMNNLRIDPKKKQWIKYFDLFYSILEEIYNSIPGEIVNAMIYETHANGASW